MRMKRIGHDSKVGCVLQTHRRDHFPQDRSAFNQKAVNYGSSWNMDGRAFDGDDYVDCGNNTSLNVTNVITISVWINTTHPANDYREILEKPSSYYLRYTNLKGIRLVVWIGGVEKGFNKDDVNVGDGKWHNVVGIYNGTNLRICVDNSWSSSSQTGTIDQTTNALNIGKTPFFIGSIDKVRIYNFVQYLMKITTGYFRRKPCIGA